MSTSRNPWAFDIHHIFPREVYRDADTAAALEAAGFAAEARGNKVALFWNPETAASVRADIAGGDTFYADAGFGGSVHPGTAGGLSHAGYNKFALEQINLIVATYPDPANAQAELTKLHKLYQRRLGGPGYVARNALGAYRPLPGFYWTAETDMRCIRLTVDQTRDEAYAHHIQRLMVTGNFALLAGIDPAQVHQWYLAVYADAYEWVEAPNTIGMAQHADGGVVGSKPYAASGAYIDRMSDYCHGCAYDVRARTGPRAYPFNLPYWDFLIRHRDRFATNPRMAQMYRSWDRMAPERRSAVLPDAARFLGRPDAGKSV